MGEVITFLAFLQRPRFWSRTEKLLELPTQAEPRSKGMGVPRVYRPWLFSQHLEWRRPPWRPLGPPATFPLRAANPSWADLCVVQPTETRRTRTKGTVARCD
jgi:hypothetical protein